MPQFQPDPVDHPAHYTQSPSGVECIDVVEWMTLNLGAAVQYIWRCWDKGHTVEDLRKAVWYLNREISRVERMQKEAYHPVNGARQGSTGCSPEVSK